MSRGYHHAEVKKWEHTRSLAYIIHVHNTDVKHRKSLTEFWPLPTDEKADPQDVKSRLLKKLAAFRAAQNQNT